MKKKTKTVKAWAVVWVAPSAADYGERHGNLIAHVEENTAACAVFKSLSEAQKWHDDNNDWGIVRCTITYSLPITRKKKRV